jgi:RNA-directed DNA polymerase
MNNSYIKEGQKQVNDNNSALRYYSGYGALYNNNRFNTNHCRPFADFRSSNSFPDSFLLKFIAAFYETRKGKRKTSNETRFELRWESNLKRLAESVWNFEYVPKRSIAFIVTVPKPREIEAADFSDRIVQQFLMNEINPYVEKYLSPRQYACRIGKGTDAAVFKAQNDIFEVSHGYTSPAWIIKLDIKSFFMSIDKALLTERLVDYLDAEYKGEYKDIVLYLIRILYNYMPVENCVRKSPIEAWDVIEKSKSLFCCEPNKGLPIGNVHVHIGANFFTAGIMKYLRDMGFERVINYTDDFLIVTDDLDDFKAKFPLIDNYIENQMHLRINKKKTYCQPYWHGVNFLGRTIKLDRIYVGNRCIHNAFERLRLQLKYNQIDCNYCRFNTSHYMASLNSTFGVLRNYSTYNIRRRFADAIKQSEFGKYLQINKDLTIWKLKNK